MQVDLEKPGSWKQARLTAFAPRNWLEGGLATLDGAGRLLDANESLLDWLELSRDSLRHQPFWDLLGAFSPDWEGAVSRFRAGSAGFDRQVLKFNPAGSSATQWFVLELARGPDTFFVRLNSVLPPLSELEEAIWDEHLNSDSARREMFMRLLRAEAQLDRLLRRWPCVVFTQRPDFSLEFVSPNVEDLTGIPPADWAAQPRRFWQLIHEADCGELEQQFKHSAQSGSKITNTFRIRHAATGRVAYILEHRQPTVTANGLLLGYDVVWLDVTRQTIAEKRLSTAAWKETLAILTLGMAHDFRNIMAGIHSLSESYLAQVTAEHPFQEGLSLITKSSLQASQLVQRMISLHLGQTGERNYHNLTEITADLVELVGKILPRRITVRTEMAAESLPVYVDAVEFRQVVINLLLNAAEAMPQGGTLTVRTSRHPALPPLENLRGVAPRLPCVCLTIEDTGGGIKERHLASIFDPFFTTKTKGSGLGLYNARLGIEKHHGAISVRSTEGAGSTFQLWLPEADFQESSQLAAEEQRNRSARRTILLLGQAGELLDRKAEFLRSHNYHIVVATVADSVAELLQSSDYNFAGIMVLAEPHDPGLAALLGEVRQHKRNLKVAVRLRGCSPDEFDTQLLQGVDLTLNPDCSQADTLGRLKSLFDLKD